MKSEYQNERILNSLDGIEKAAVPDFFYTRLTARMQNAHESAKGHKFLLRPAFATTALFILLMINIFSIIEFNNGKMPVGSQLRSGNAATLESFANAYNLTSQSIYP
jgi:hypothetical protein